MGKDSKGSASFERYVVWLYKQRMTDFSILKKSLKKPVKGFKTIRLAILGDSATQFVAQAIKGMGVENSLNLEIFEAEFNP